MTGLMIRRMLPLIAFAPLALAQITADQTMKARELSDPRFSPAGARVAVVVRDPFTARFAVRHIWVYDVASREMRRACGWLVVGV